jgi:signal peptidase I
MQRVCLCEARVATVFWYIAHLVSDSSANLAPATIGKTVPPQPSSVDTKRRVIAALLSALTPGAGQLLLGQRRKGIALLLVFFALLACIWPLRLPRSFAPLVLIVLIWIGLVLYAACAALFGQASPSAKRPSKLWLLAILMMSYVGINLVFTPIFLVSGFRALQVNSSAMERTLFIGDHFIIDKNYYRHYPVARNDLVLMRREDYQTVKRVIAASGDTIEGKNRKIAVNGEFVDEPFIQHSLTEGTNPEMDSFGPVSIPSGKCFVMGDNRDVSLDSRNPDFGLVDAQAIIGKPLYIYRSPMKGRAGKKLN